ncbi:MAG: hypothetical protein LBG72_01465 [Spirochaetaceae bacterium]|jgi:hypothetical protein|nr:hypothetical protein [Spirochaetaceae bacterium]
MNLQETNNSNSRANLNKKKIDAADLVNIFIFRLKKFAAGTKKFILNLNEDTIAGIWVALILAAGMLVWGFTAKTRLAGMAGMANRLLTEIGDTRSLDQPVSSWVLPGTASAAGSWYMTNSREIAVIFLVFNEGVFSPCLVIFTADGRIDSFLPLSRQARLSTERAFSKSVSLQKAHIEKTAQSIIRKLDGGKS